MRDDRQTRRILEQRYTAWIKQEAEDAGIPARLAYNHVVRDVLSVRTAKRRVAPSSVHDPRYMFSVAKSISRTMKRTVPTLIDGILSESARGKIAAAIVSSLVRRGWRGIVVTYQGKFLESLLGAIDPRVWVVKTSRQAPDQDARATITHWISALASARRLSREDSDDLLPKAHKLANTLHLEREVLRLADIVIVHPADLLDPAMLPLLRPSTFSIVDIDSMNGIEEWIPITLHVVRPILIGSMAPIFFTTLPKRDRRSASPLPDPVPDPDVEILLDRQSQAVFIETLERLKRHRWVRRGRDAPPGLPSPQASPAIETTPSVAVSEMDRPAWVGTYAAPAREVLLDVHADRLDERIKIHDPRTVIDVIQEFIARGLESIIPIDVGGFLRCRFESNPFRRTVFVTAGKREAISMTRGGFRRRDGDGEDARMVIDAGGASLHRFLLLGNKCLVLARVQRPPPASPAFAVLECPEQAWPEEICSEVRWIDDAFLPLATHIVSRLVKSKRTTQRTWNSAMGALETMTLAMTALTHIDKSWTRMLDVIQQQTRSRRFQSRLRVNEPLRSWIAREAEEEDRFTPRDPR